MTATFGGSDFAWLDGLRRAHFPPERNIVPAHLTLFHHLPPSAEPELRARLASIAAGSGPPDAVTGDLLDLGRGTAIRIVSQDLALIRSELADAFSGLLTPQDRTGWRPHVTIQNKVAPAEAKALRLSLGDFPSRRVLVTGLALWRYVGGPWKSVARYAFRGSG